MNFYEYANTKTPETNGTKDGMSAGDNDVEYRFGQPKTYLNTGEIARLLILRGRLQNNYGQPLLSVAGAL